MLTMVNVSGTFGDSLVKLHSIEEIPIRCSPEKSEDATSSSSKVLKFRNQRKNEFLNNYS